MNNESEDGSKAKRRYKWSRPRLPVCHTAEEPLGMVSMLPWVALAVKNAQRAMLTQASHAATSGMGAGTAGSVVANRLSVNTSYKVLLLEAGGEMTPDLMVPFTAPFAANKNNSWEYETEPQLFSLFTQDRAPVTLGQVMGGTGSINSMNFVRGSKHDFDKWKSDYKANGWSYEEVLPYFKKIEYFNITHESIKEKEKYHGSSGETPINYPGYYTNLSYVFLNACKEADYKYVDYNGESHKGYSRVQSNTAYGVRMGPSTCFLNEEIRSKVTNLHIHTYSVVKEIIIEGNRAVGVKFKKGGEESTVRASREVILCAGAVNTPKLLMLSGIGPREDLDRVKIPVKVELPVGRGLQDHVIFLGLVVTTNGDLIGLSHFNESVEEYKRTRTGLLTIPGAFEALLFTRSGVGNETEDDPDIELELTALFPSPEIEKSKYVSKEVYKKYYQPMFGSIGFMNAVAMVKPKSRGSVRLRTKNPDDNPSIDPRMFSENIDLTRLVNGTLKLLKLFEMQSMKKVNATVWQRKFPYCEQFDVWSPQYVTCFAQHTAFPGQHVCCTCAMGEHNDAVVDSRLRVKNVAGLRVVDASVMPQIVSGNTYATVLMIGEKGAEMILQDAKNNQPVMS
ncbi:4-pyridoxate dehydrogenase [Rhipicephalus sanguineus]|uniref:4-pyridoxate dehydrogenase n=1 Tax=Rhipicephalus sanguineus TaxID=34632 RepID=UPI0020C58C83|nr:4-pyridoxate dehydrogenase [Rhipicephalus sanguineus]